MKNMITITTSYGNMKASAKWKGEALAVHRPVSGFNKFSTTPCYWSITHLESGLTAGFFEGSVHKAIQLAKAWDKVFKKELPGTEPQAHLWDRKDQWRAQLQQFKPICAPDTAEYVIAEYVE
jgi:hypothetical protein